jgi:hypothetical protein
MNDFGDFGVVYHLDAGRLAFTEAQDGTGSGAIVCGGLDYFPRTDFELDWRDTERYVGFGGFLPRLQCEASGELGASRDRQ